MCYYAAQATGFRPSMSCIDEATGIGAKNISTYRKHLVDKGFIGYDGNIILIDWVRIRGFASMDRKLIGKPTNWTISPVDSNCYEIVKTQVHNYIGTMSSADKRLYAIYEATAEAIADGVEFPELRSDYIVDPIPNCYEIVKTQVHNYIGDVDFSNGPGVVERGSGWYNPFDEPDPEWVYQIPICDAYGQIVAFAHYDTRLPF